MFWILFFLMIINSDILKADCMGHDEEIRRIDYFDYLNDFGGIFRDEFNEEETGLNKEKKFITISLGCNCNPAKFTRHYGIRTFAFPFDWCFTPYKALYNFINNDFKDYLKKENLVPSSKKYFSSYLQDFFNQLNCAEVSEYHTWVLDKEFGSIFIHDFSNNSFSKIRSEHEFNYNKYWRRIKRLYEATASGKHIYFIRYHHITKQEACDLCQLLKNKFPKTNFTLIVIGVDPAAFAEDWRIPHIRNLCLRFDNNFWQKLCKDIADGVFQ
jgi:hypothetical protein